MIEAADQAGVKLAVISQRRLYEPVLRVKRALDEGRRWSTRFANAHRLDGSLATIQRPMVPVGRDGIAHSLPERNLSGHNKRRETLMREMTIGAKVECKDGTAGETTHLIVDPVTEAVTHYVVKEEARPHPERLVPVSLEIESSPELIKLDCTLAEFSDLAPFRYTTTYDTSLQAYEGAGFVETGHAMRTFVVDRVQVPEGELAVALDSKVEATDGVVGRVDGLLTSEETGVITHLLMRKGHAWGQKEVVIPRELIDYEHEGTVHLNVDKDKVSELLSLRAAWGRGPSEDELEEALDGE
jgi:hypothetical protein